MVTEEAFIHALGQAHIKNKYIDSTLRTWKSRAKRKLLSIDFMLEFLLENGYVVKQEMQWRAPMALAGPVNATVVSNAPEQWVPKTETFTTSKSELCKKLYEVRKEMNKELLAQWFAWAKAEYANEYAGKKNSFNEQVFIQITSGRYISKEHTMFALKTLREGKRILQEYEAEIEKEINSL